MEILVKVLEIKTNKESEMIDITNRIQNVIDFSNIKSGLAVLFVPHTTAAITINENADPDVKRDMLLGLSRVFPQYDDYLHAEGNSPAHLKSSTIGCDQTIIIEDGKLQLGTWQGIYFCEFDGPRHRKLIVKIIE